MYNLADGTRKWIKDGQKDILFALAHLAADHLKGDKAVHGVLAGGEDDGHAAAADLVNDSSISLAPSDEGCRVSLDGEDVTELLRTPEVAEAASMVARVPAVRKTMVRKQRSIAADAVEQFGGAVLEGRDIGTVVFPDAELKIFLDADLGERARRRVLELSDEGITANEVQEQIHRRDVADQHLVDGNGYLENLRTQIDHTFLCRLLLWSIVLEQLLLLLNHANYWLKTRNIGHKFSSN